jgi:hypothetical protein
MAEGPRSQASSVLGVLADLSPSAQQRSAALTVPLDWFRWLPLQAVRLFAVPSYGDPDPVPPTVTIDRDEGERLAAIDRLRPEQRSLRAGWLFVAGRQPLGDGRMQRVFHPLVTVPVRIDLPAKRGRAVVWPAGDASVTELVTDTARRHELEAGYELGGGALRDVASPEMPEGLLARLERLRHFALSAAKAAGFDVRTVRRASIGPDALLREDGLCVVAGIGIYTTTEVGGLSAAEFLRTWADRPLPEATAFHAVYLGTGTAPGDQGAGVTGEVHAPFPLAPQQRKAVALSRNEPVSVVSGAAGTGKSHTVSAIACDAVARGQTVLVAAKSDAAVDALLALLADAPGLDPVVFGSSERRDALARRLASGELQPSDGHDLGRAEGALHEAMAGRARIIEVITAGLRAESHLQQDPALVDHARRTAPGLFDPALDLREVHHLLGVAATEGGWWRRRRAAKARARLLASSGAIAGTSGDDLRHALSVAEGARQAGELVAAGGLRLEPTWARLEAAEADVHEKVARWLALASRSPERLSRSSLPAVAVLGTALRSGRAARREQLARLDHRLTRALPLWVGTLGDIEDLLPPAANLFDLVILDEASVIDQPLAAPALLRARRTVVVGDPHQLRHVSFLADAELRRAAEAHAIADPLLVGRLDVRRNSLFDVAAGVAPATVLDEHFRSAPHLIDFVAERLYGGRLHVATRTPATEDRDCIEIIRKPGRRDQHGVVRHEVDAVVELLRRLQREGATSVGVITPFRAQADALEAAVLGAFRVHDIDALDLRVGTVHSFQGNERDVVLISMGIGQADSATTWRFAEDPHLFAVLATRARRRLVVLLSAEPPAQGLLADYLAQGDAPPGRPCPAGRPRPWVQAVHGWLEAAGVPSLPLYPTGRHTVDVCAGDDRRFLGLECTVHPDGPAAHVERHLALRRGGWDLVDAYPSRWRDRQGELVVELTRRLDVSGDRTL